MGRVQAQHRRRRRRIFGSSTGLLALLTAIIAASLSHLSFATSMDVIADLYPEKSLDFQKIPCGKVKLYHVHDLDPNKAYDLKISYPATLPTAFTVDVQQMLLTPTTTNGDGDVIRKVPRRMLNTEKLRLLPQELLRKWHPNTFDDQQMDQEIVHRNEKFRFDDLPGGDGSKTPLKQGEFIVEIAVRGDVEGISPTHAPSDRVCVYNIVVEELLFEAFPHDTVVLIAWLVVLLAITLRLVYPFVLSLVALEQPADQAITAEQVLLHTKAS